MQDTFGGNKQLRWDQVAEYSGFLAELHAIGRKITQGKGVKEDYEKMSDYIVRQLEIVDGEDLLRSQSLYEMIKHTK